MERNISRATPTSDQQRMAEIEEELAAISHIIESGVEGREVLETDRKALTVEWMKLTRRIGSHDGSVSPEAD